MNVSVWRKLSAQEIEAIPEGSFYWVRIKTGHIGHNGPETSISLLQRTEDGFSHGDDFLAGTYNQFSELAEFAGPIPMPVEPVEERT